MDETKRLLAHAQSHAPDTPYTFDDLLQRRGRQARHRRLSATIVGLGLTVAIIGGATFALVASRAPRALSTVGGDGLPAPVRTVALGPGEYSYQRIRIQGSSTCAGCGVDGVDLHVESWWASDGSGRIDVLKAQNYGIHGGTFGPGQFPDEGDLTAFPTGPAALQEFLLQRSAPEGASPRPDVTPAPGVPLEDGQLWLAIHDYLGSTQYLNATPELRAAMLQVLAKDPMVSVDTDTVDPLGRRASALRFYAYGAHVSVFVDPTTGDFLATTERFDDGSTGSVIVEEAGIVAGDHAVPKGPQQTVSAAATLRSP
jgi:hypothetical protein